MQQLINQLNDHLGTVLMYTDALGEQATKIAQEARGKYCKDYQRELSRKAGQITYVSQQLEALKNVVESINYEG